MGTELEKAIKGEKVSDKQTKTALGQAIKKISTLSKKAEGSKLALKDTGSAVLATAETHGSLFLASMAEGYLGPDKIKVGAVDVRAPIALVGMGWGLYEVATGGPGGAHALAVGNGLMGSWLASVATQAGRTLAEKKGGGAPAETTPATPQPSIQGELLPPPPVPIQALPQPGVSGDFGEDDDAREVVLTPEAEVEEVHVRRRRPPKPRGRRRGRPRRKGRFVRARKRH